MCEYHAMKSTREIFWKLKLQCHKWENYFDVYDEMLLPFVDKHPKVLEIGVAHGGSLEMWIEYFEGKLDLYGVDINKEYLDYKFDDAHVQYSCVDQGSQEHWDAYLSDNKRFDIIVDDGSHVMNDQIVTLLNLFPKLNNNGIYLIEDTHTSYWNAYGGGLKKESSCIEFCKHLADLLHAPHINETPPPKLKEVFVDLHSVTFYNSLILLKKKYIEHHAKPAHNDESWDPNFKWG